MKKFGDEHVTNCEPTEKDLELPQKLISEITKNVYIVADKKDKEEKKAGEPKKRGRTAKKFEFESIE